YEYFILARNPEEGKAITGKFLTNAAADFDHNKMKPAVTFHFDTEGGNLFWELTSKNAPKDNSESANAYRHLAIILDGVVQSAPSLLQPIRTNGQITGDFTDQKVKEYVRILRSGALPATLKSQPVSENSMGATLGGDTIRKGTFSVALAFLVVLVFM